jgi:uncharacterized repeat protein (TIGR02543 family)
MPLLLAIFLGILFSLTLSMCTNPFMKQLLIRDQNPINIPVDDPTIPNDPDEPGDPEIVYHTVIFNSNGGSAVAGQTVAEGGTASRPDNPAKPGFDFVNWYSNEDLTEPHYDFATPVTADLTLYAKWNNVLYTVRFESNGGSAVESQTVNEGDMAERPENPSKPGFGFVNWYSNAAFNEPHYDFENTPITENLTLYAKWSSIFFTVTFVSNGGSNVVEQEVGEGGTASRPIPTRSGYLFENWYKDEEMTDLYNFAAPVTGHITLYANWIPNTATITITVADIVDKVPNINGGTISRGGTNKTITFELEEPGLYDEYKWSIYVISGEDAGTFITLSTGSSVTINASDQRYNSLGGHTVYLEVRIGTLWYSTNIEFRIVE